MENREKLLIILSVSFITIALFFLGATITGFASVPVEYRDLCRADDDCVSGKLCCISYQKENIGLCMKACQNVQFICAQDSDCTEGVCCKSEGSLGICNKADKCMDAPVLNSELYEKLKAVEPEMQSPAPLTLEEYKDRYRIAFLIEMAIILALAVILWHVVKDIEHKKHGKKK